MGYICHLSNILELKDTNLGSIFRFKKNSSKDSRNLSNCLVVPSKSIWDLTSTPFPWSNL